jgi:hypothetical protein
MFRLLLFFIIVAALVFWGWKHYYFERGAHTPHSFTEAVSDPSASPTPEPQSLEECEQQLLLLSEDLLKPMEQSQNFPMDQAWQSLVRTERKLSQFRLSPGYNRAAQACLLIEQAWKERAVYEKQLKNTDPGTLLDKVSGRAINKHPTLTTGGGTPPPPNSTKDNLQQRDDFFRQSDYRAWNGRADFYRPRIEQLLAH